MSLFVVTIDGPAAAGKSTTARAVAQELGFLYVDTGALYRALALKVQNGGIAPDDREAVERCGREAQIGLSGSPEQTHVWLDGMDVSREIRTSEVSELASRLAAQPAVRARLAEIQRELRARGPLVAEGRDLGTVVYPDADVKIYLDADLAIRAHRRAHELHERGIPMAPEDVREDIDRRDLRDRSRTESPLAVPQGAHVIDTSSMAAADVAAAVLGIARSHPAFPERKIAPSGRAAAPPAKPSGSEPGGRGNPRSAETRRPPKPARD